MRRGGLLILATVAALLYLQPSQNIAYAMFGALGCLVLLLGSIHRERKR